MRRAALLLVALALAACDDSGGAADAYTRRIWAQVECQDAIEAQLRAPSTADFPASEQTFSIVSNGNAAVTGAVDAQNGFGAKVRNRFACTLRPATDTTWTVMDAAILP